MRPELRSTRRGWMMFQQADAAAAAGNSGVVDQAAQAAADEKAKADAAASGPLDYKTLLLTLLDLDPATADDAAIKTAFDAEEAAPEVDIAALQTKASSADALQAQYDDLQLQYQELNKKQEEIWKAKQEAEADEILSVYKDRFVDEAAMAPVRQILISDKEAGIAILNGLKKPDAAAPSGTQDDKSATPPAPKHDPAATAQQASEKEAADKISARAREIVKASNPKVSLTKAYQMAEAELNKAA